MVVTEATAVDIQDMVADMEATLVVDMEDTQEVDMEVASVQVRLELQHNLPVLTKEVDSAAHSEALVDQDSVVVLVDPLPVLKLPLDPLAVDMDLADKAFHPTSRFLFPWLCDFI